MLMVPCLVAAEDHAESSSLSAAANTTYKKKCGSCHFAYQPALLPERSWLSILNNPGTHAGGTLALDKTAKGEIEKYLTQNSAERDASERSQKILASLGSDTPVRISEVPYIKKKHREINETAFLTKSVGSRANCPACHRSADKGVYDDHDAAIPK